MIHIGNQTSCWAPSPAEPFYYAVANGFDAFEWFPDKKLGVGWDDTDLDSSQREKVRETAKAKGMRLSVHSRWQANPLHPEAAELLRKDIQLALDLGAVLLNVHLHHEAGIERYVDSIRSLIQWTQDAKLQLSIENTPEHSPEQFNELFAHLRRQHFGPHVGMCFDLGHANLSAATRNDYLAFVDRLDLDLPIIHLHLHENWGDGDTHLTLFTGPAAQNDSGIRGFVQRIRKRDFSGSIILEQWPQPPSLLNQARDRLLGLLGPEKKDSAGLVQPEETTDKSDGDETSRSTSQTPIQPVAATDSHRTFNRKYHDFFEALIESDQRSRSWREKLDAVRELLVGENSRLGENELAYLAIYLRFLSTGQIACAEDGRHFRPGHHARISQEIQQRLSTVSTPDLLYLIRKIYSALPSSAEIFQRAEPLTRIRDIAHRNDIPSELKREIKSTLQNKLHRCAGPEDLVTSQKLLDRISAPGANYSTEFVAQFRVFHQELQEFFNASSLDARLNSVKATLGPQTGEFISNFFQQKTTTGFEEHLSTFKSLTSIRDALASAIKKEPGAGWDLITADIGLEDFAFVLLSQLLNDFEASEPRRSGNDLLDPLGMAILNLALSGIFADECQAVRAELDAWRMNFDPQDRDQLLRLKATIERGRRIAETFSERVIGAMLSRAQELGKALGVADHAIRAFCEAEIRSHLVFQLSKIASLLLRRLREALDLPGWDVLVSGRASGRLKVLEQLRCLEENGPDPTILILKRAEGDEEIPISIKGILLAHAIPHLSHLGVRARQAGVVFAGAEVESNLNQLLDLQGETIRLEAAPDKVTWERTEGDENANDADFGNPSVARKALNVVSVRKNDLLIVPCDQVTIENSGQKAFGLKRLKQLSAKMENGFLVPSAHVIPFGVMETLLSMDGQSDAQYWRLVDELDSEPVQRLEAKAERLRAAIRNIRVPAEIASAIVKAFQSNERLMIRSSANCEDLENFAGAGLHDSIPNVSPQNAAPAILRVWSSLWTQRAVLSRHQAGISQKQAQMAVIIQQMLAPDYSFVLHTKNPLTHREDEVYAELAVGLGETLASAAARGTPYRLVCNKQSGEVQTLAFANFSFAIRPDSKGGVSQELLDYSRVALSRDLKSRAATGRQLAAIGSRVEMEFERPQDIEGAIVDGKIYLVQSRGQQGL